MSFFKEFRDFAVKGNVVDMAVGLILGASFNKIVNSMVNDILMPPLGMAIGRVDFKMLTRVLQSKSVGADGKEIAEVAIRYGMFINTVIEFAIVAFSVFVVIKIMNRLIKGREAAAAK